MDKKRFNEFNSLSAICCFSYIYVERKVVLIKVSVSLHIDTLNQMNFLNHIFFYKMLIYMINIFILL